MAPGEKTCPHRHPQLADAGLEGWPRPLRAWKDPAANKEHAPGGERAHMPEKLPAPWMNGPHIESDGDWHSFRNDYARAHDQRLCVVCGQPNGRRIILGNYRTAPPPSTSGPGGHPRCMNLAVRTCPHLVEQHDGVVAWEYVGDGCGYTPNFDAAGGLELGGGEAIDETARPLTVAQLRDLARHDPLGVGTPAPESADALTRCLARVTVNAGSCDR